MPLTSEELRAYKKELDKARATLAPPGKPTNQQLKEYIDELRRAREGSTGIWKPAPPTSEQISEYNSELEKSRGSSNQIAASWGGYTPKESHYAKPMTAPPPPNYQIRPEPGQRPGWDPYIGGYPTIGSPMPGTPGRGTPGTGGRASRPIGNLPVNYNPSLGGTAGWSAPLNDGLIRPEDPNKLSPIYRKNADGSDYRDPQTGQYEIAGWRNAAGGQVDLPAERNRSWAAFQNSWSNPLQTGLEGPGDGENPGPMLRAPGALWGRMETPGVLEDEPEAAFSLMVNAMNLSPAAKSWLTRQYPRLRSLYTGQDAANPSPMSWLKYLGGLDLQKEYLSATPYERGVQPRRFAPLTKFLGW